MSWKRKKIKKKSKNRVQKSTTNPKISIPMERFQERRENNDFLEKLEILLNEEKNNGSF